jgi:hypothetical protein
MRRIWADASGRVRTPRRRVQLPPRPQSTDGSDGPFCCCRDPPTGPFNTGSMRKSDGDPSLGLGILDRRIPRMAPSRSDGRDEPAQAAAREKPRRPQPHGEESARLHRLAGYGLGCTGDRRQLHTWCRFIHAVELLPAGWIARAGGWASAARAPQVVDQAVQES